MIVPSSVTKVSNLGLFRFPFQHVARKKRKKKKVGGRENRYTGLKNVNGMVCTDVSWHYKTGTVWTGPGPWPPAGMNPDLSTWLNEPTSPEKAKKDMDLSTQLSCQGKKRSQISARDA